MLKSRSRTMQHSWRDDLPTTDLSMTLLTGPALSAPAFFIYVDNLITPLIERYHKGMNEQVKVFGAVAIAAILIGAVFYYSSTSDDVLPIRDSDLEQLAATTSVSVPSANPLKQISPTENPLDVTNPFNQDYENPFE